MPGVATEDMKIDLNDGVLTLSDAVWPWEHADGSDILVETALFRPSSGERS